MGLKFGEDLPRRRRLIGYSRTLVGLKSPVVAVDYVLPRVLQQNPCGVEV